MDYFRFALVALTAALVGETVVCKEHSIDDSNRVSLKQRPNVNSALTGRWFLCYKNNTVQACKNKKIQRLQKAKLVIRQARGLCSKRTCRHGNCTEGKCVCHEGWEGNRCTRDVNECTRFVFLCSQRCYNTPGSYECRCFSHYSLHDDKHTCLSTRRYRNSTRKYGYSNVEIDHTPQPKQEVSSKGRKVRVRNKHRQISFGTGMLSTLTSTNTSFLSLLDEAENAGRAAIKSINRFLNKVQLLKKQRRANARSLVKSPLALRARSNPCQRARCSHGCVITADNRPKCVCRRGYKLDKTKRRCIESSRCSLSKNVCPANSVCKNEPNGYKCTCILGYVHPENETGSYCEDINECLTGDHICSDRAICINMPGYYRCECMAGYHGDGINCTLNYEGYDLNEFPERSRMDDIEDESFQASEQEKVILLRKRSPAFAKSSKKRRNRISRSSRRSRPDLLIRIKKFGKQSNAQ